MSLKMIPDSHVDLLGDNVRAYAYLATTMDDGSPQLTPVWFNTDQDHILINTQYGRVKDRNMRLRPQISLVIQDPGDPLRYVQIRGRVVGITEEDAKQHINILAGKYTGKAEFKLPNPDVVRVIFSILPDHVQVSG